MFLQNLSTSIWVMILLTTKVSLAIPDDDFSDSVDDDQSRKILGSSVVTSVSVIMDNGNGSKTVYTDALGKPVGKPPAHADLASPINLLNPDRYEFYTFDDNGNLVRRLMSLEEIKTIIATGDSDGLEFDSMISESYIPEKKVKDVLTNVQDVLKEEMELHKNKLGTNTIFDTPDVSDSWSMILPAVFGNSGADIKPEKPIVHITPDTITIETQDNVQSTMKPTTSTLKLDETTVSATPLSVDLFSTTYSPVVQEKNTVTTSNDIKHSTTDLISTDNVSSTIKTVVNNPTISSNPPQKQIPTQITDNPQVMVNQEKSASVTSSPNNDISQTTISMEKTETETVTSDSQTPSPTDSSTELPDNAQFSTWTPSLSTVLETKEVIMPLSTWRPDLSNNQDGTSSSSSVMSSTFTTNEPASSSNKTELMSSQSSRTTVPETTFPSTTPFFKAESETNKWQTVEETTQEILTTPLQVFQTNENNNNSNNLQSIQLELSTKFFEAQTESPKEQQDAEMSERTTLEKLLTTDMSNNIDRSTTDPTFIGSLQELLSQTLNDVGGLVSSMNDTLEMPSPENITKIQSMAKLENEIPLTPLILQQIWPFLVLVPRLLNPIPKCSVVLCQHLKQTYLRLLSDQNTEVVKNQTLETSGTKIELDKSILMNNTVPNSKENIKSSDSQQAVNNTGPIKNTKNEIGAETTTTTVMITQDTTVGVTTSVETSAPEDNTSEPPVTTESEGKTEITTEIHEVGTVHAPGTSSAGATDHPTVEIIISEKKTNTSSEKTEKHENVTDKKVMKSNVTQTNITVINKFGENEIDTSTVVPNSNENIIDQTTVSSYVSEYQTTEKSIKYTNNTLGNDTISSGNKTSLQKGNIPGMSTSASSHIPNFSTTEKIANNNSNNTTNDITKDKNIVVLTVNASNISSEDDSSNESNSQLSSLGANSEDIKKQPDADDAWTLVSIITPHPSVTSPQKVQQPQQSYADFIAPSTPIDLKAKPLQGFGLEDTTTSLDTDIFQFTQLCNELAFDFWKTATSELSSARSVFLSPFGAMSLLAMIFLGARGSTSGEMNEILKLDDMVTFNPHLIFKDVSESITMDKPNSGVVSSAIVRELFSDKMKGKLLPFYKERAKAFYDGFVEDVNFNEIGDVIRRRTNLQVKKYTKGKIREFLKDASISARSPLAGVSVNIFQTDCAKTSTEGRDGELHFVVLPSIRQRRLVPIPAAVYKSGFLAGYEPSLDATAVSIGTKDQITSTIFVIPGQQGMPAPGDGLARLEKSLVESSFKKGAWSRLLRSLIPREGLEVQIPRIGHRSIINATSALKRMGMRELFNKQRADLSGMNGIPNELFLSDLLQVNSFSTCGDVGAGDKHHFEIYPAESNRQRRFLSYDGHEDIYSNDETLDSNQGDFIDPLYTPRFLDLPLPARPRQARVPDTPRLKFDRPFLYFVRHNPTGLILHIGRFNPRLLP
ncbi:LOW QUALITY PROTEIN: uncharacterized protein [Leptinotarsa decemlineata]|uniref:LOW QUALITY PROTEIN: uncharacterized protein n=1 Tax=Leptinotarsa decemlineata TaxID=7539 RepID=UPI003D30A3A3